jgi:hypothetical protein
MFVRFWQAGFDADNNPSRNGNDAPGRKGRDAVESRPFMAGLVVSVPSTTVHIHAAESLRCSLVMVTAHHTLTTRGVPCVSTMARGVRILSELL